MAPMTIWRPRKKEAVPRKVNYRKRGAQSPDTCYLCCEVSPTALPSLSASPPFTPCPLSVALKEPMCGKVSSLTSTSAVALDDASPSREDGDESVETWNSPTTSSGQSIDCAESNASSYPTSDLVLSDVASSAEPETRPLRASCSELVLASRSCSTFRPIIRRRRSSSAA
eukprot:scaffold166299_cov32-Tisochrysis_lutea.AAC.2